MNNATLPPTTPEQELAKRTRRGFLGLGLGAAAAAGGWQWLWSQPQEGGVPVPLRSVLDANARLNQNLLFRDAHLAPEFPPERIQAIRANGDFGLEGALDADAWRLALTPWRGAAPLQLTMADLKKLNKLEYTAEFKCIEGWSSIVRWGGVRFRDFVALYAPGAEKAAYVSLTTPDKEYFVGVDMASMLHPQTMLCFEKNGQPLELAHGAPLRLVIPVKYGIKNIKRIGTISFSDQAPPDYWAEEGYDYYAGL
ncbi:MAG: molybdopterin-dependent oxidoreductase [Acidobacteria bacterium]|nr:molybdopterin-dependent oxidoreductase [Acidobacteriota bacterium]